MKLNSSYKWLGIYKLYWFKIQNILWSTCTVGIQNRPTKQTLLSDCWVWYDMSSGKGNKSLCFVTRVSRRVASSQLIRHCMWQARKYPNMICCTEWSLLTRTGSLPNTGDLYELMTMENDLMDYDLTATAVFMNLTKLQSATFLNSVTLL